MMYRPNFCAECGERVVRASWPLWASRRFCKYCARNFSRKRFAKYIIAVIGLVGVGVLVGRAMRRRPPPLVIQSNQHSSAPQRDAVPNQKAEQPPQASRDRTHDSPSVSDPTGARSVDVSDTGETVHICGARTKKGTPCTRRVEGPGRCWQHKNL
jgi:hypothetical protein